MSAGMVTTNFSEVAISILKNIMISAGSSYKYQRNEWQNVISKAKTDMMINKRMRFEGGGALPEQTENADASSTSFRQGYIETTSLSLFSYDMPISWHLRKFATSNAKMVNQMGAFLGRSAALRYEYTGMSPLNNGFSTTAPYASGDTKAYFSASHAWKSGGTFSNLLTSADVNKTSLESGLKNGANAKQENNIPASIVFKQITFAYENIFKVPELLKSSLDPESANNTYNVFLDFGLGKFLSHYASDSDQWTLDGENPSRTLYEAEGTRVYRYFNDGKKQLVVGISNCIGSGHHDHLNSFGNQGA